MEPWELRINEAMEWPETAREKLNQSTRVNYVQEQMKETIPICQFPRISVQPITEAKTRGPNRVNTATMQWYDIEGRWKEVVKKFNVYSIGALGNGFEGHVIM